MLHDFRESLARSHAQEEAPWWAEIYGRAFPGYLSAVSVRNDGWWQRAGIDRVITLQSSKTIKIDEKVREKEYDDILLEVWSDRDKGTRGWIQKELACDFIAYAFVQSQRCYLFPWHNLRSAWRLECKTWCEWANERRNGFRVIEAQNRSYVTESIAVPTEILLSTIRQTMVISWGTA